MSARELLALWPALLLLQACSGSSDAQLGGGGPGQDGGVVTEAGSDGAPDAHAEGAPCASQCDPGEGRCVAGLIQTCRVGSSGCAQWDPPSPCPAAAPYCSEGTCEATCQNECQLDALRCTGNAWQKCLQLGTGCLGWSAVVECGTAELCVDGSCVPSCGGQPCPCSPGETLACSDIGACHGGLRSCEGGQFGPCQWQTGPKPEECNLVDDDCNGAVDDGLVSPPCANQTGACAGAMAVCGGAQGWLPCGPAQYAAHAQSLGMTWEASESLCDSIDNDCNGAIDEPASCCAPQCAGKACGAPNGCGGICTTGTCPANATCQSGACQCTYESCGQACCPSGGQCVAGACCTPQCGTRECGPDPACGSSCGTCASGASCTPQGQCLTGPTWQVMPSPVSTTLYDVWGASANNVWAVGEGGVVLHYSAGQWTTVSSGTSNTLQGIWGVNASDIWAVGLSATTLHYNGSAWAGGTTTVTEHLRDVWGSASAGWYAVGDNGRVVYLNGSQWSTCCNWTTGGLTEVWGRGANDYLLGGYEKLYRVTSTATYVHSYAYSSVNAIHGNATSTWVIVRRPNSTEVLTLTGDYFSVKHTDSRSYAAMWVTPQGELWAVGEGILHYDGTTWTLDKPSLPYFLHGLWRDPGGEMFAVGTGGTILHYH